MEDSQAHGVALLHLQQGQQGVERIELRHVEQQEDEMQLTLPLQPVSQNSRRINAKRLDARVAEFTRLSAFAIKANINLALRDCDAIDLVFLLY